MSADSKAKVWTVDEFEKYVTEHGEPGIRYSLIDGELVEEMTGSGIHGEIGFLLLLFLGNFVMLNKLGRCTTAETGFIIGEKEDGSDAILAPDGAFLSFQTAPEPLTTGYVQLTPDLVFEVISPSESRSAVEEKTQKYLLAGVQIVWLVYPQSQTIAVHTADGLTTHDINGTLTGGDVLPGFSVPVREIFPR